MKNIGPLNSCPEAALKFYEAGFPVIPIVRGAKRTSVKWLWEQTRSRETISAHYGSNPSDELGCILGEKLLVLDGDSPESVQAVERLMDAHGIASNFVVKTRRGRHFFFSLTPGAFAKSSSYSSDAYPDRIDVKHGRTLVVLPPSTDKVIEVCEIGTIDDLVQVDQEFVDAVFAHNGQPPPRPPSSPAPRPPPDPEHIGPALQKAAALLDKIDPDCGYDDWFRCLAAIHHESAGSEAGFDLVNAWSAKGTKYPGENELRNKWNSLADYSGTPITLGTLNAMVTALGHDWRKVCGLQADEFFSCDTETVASPPTVAQSLLPYSLTGSSAALEKEVQEQVHILGRIALLGQWTVLFGPPNSGKTLITLRMLINAIKHGRVRGSCVFYINVDDTLSGLIDKLKMAEKSGFHMLAEAHRQFTADLLILILRQMIADDQCRGVVLIMDTLKKFCDVMSKQASTEFGKLMRAFVLQGGTVIVLGHTNKRPKADGKLDYAGTADILQDADCAYIISETAVDPDSQTRTVIFENIKSRGDVARQASFRYSIAEGLHYLALLESVECLEDEAAAAVREAAQVRNDAPLIEVVRSSIEAGENLRMALLAKMRQVTSCPRSRAEQVLDRYTGDNPDKHRWNFRVGAKGAKEYYLIDLEIPRIDF
jgi:hypothetical protein